MEPAKTAQAPKAEEAREKTLEIEKGLTKEQQAVVLAFIHGMEAAVSMQQTV